MSKKVYVFGAGVNQAIHYLNTTGISYSPPLSTDFFKVLFGIDFYSSVLARYYDSNCKGLSEYISEFWNMDKQQLIEMGLNLEEFYTKLQEQRQEAESKKKEDDLMRWNYVYTLINKLFLGVLTVFKYSQYNSHSFLKLGRLLYKEEPTIITFNYDTFVERVIEVASGKNETSSPFQFKWNWNKALAYGIKFDGIVYDGQKIHNKEISGKEY